MPEKSEFDKALGELYDLTEITTERFGWCSEKKCMAYNNGRCKMLEEEMAHE